ncbi:hypothetical protein [Streptomyces sp. UG1]|uniref:hypothetical protein n=1 Tax=Streptomyces sp. UG1 TaxID=3417652 RepID=UPI003CF1ABAD
MAADEYVQRPRLPGHAPSQTAFDGKAITFQLWHRHEDGERHDLERFQPIPTG